MKQKTTTWLICVIYIISIFVIYYGVNEYISTKDKKLRQEALNALNSFFEDKPMYVDLLYGPYNFKYEQIQIPEPETPDFLAINTYMNIFKDDNISYEEAYKRIQQNLHKKWKEKYGNVTKLYSLDIYPTESERISESGWALRVISKIPDRISTFSLIAPGSGIQSYLIFPAKVAYKSISPLLQGSIPTIELAVEDALYFTIKNEKSDLQPYYSRGSTYKLIERMKKNIDNEFYYLEITKTPLFYYNDGTEPYESGGMYNGYYEVSFKQTQPTTYSIKRIDESYIQNEKYILIAIYVIIITIITSIILVIIRKQQHNHL